MRTSKYTGLNSAESDHHTFVRRQLNGWCVAMNKCRLTLKSALINFLGKCVASVTRFSFMVTFTAMES